MGIEYSNFQICLADCAAGSVAVLLLGMSGGLSQAQMGPVDMDGFVEYRYSQFNGKDVDARSSQGLLLKTNLSTFFWRPWILNATGHVSYAQNAKPDARLGDEKKRRYLRRPATQFPGAQQVSADPLL